METRWTDKVLLLTSCVFSLIGADQPQVLRFDVSRNFVIKDSPSPVCAKLQCSIRSNGPETDAIAQPLAIWIFDEDDSGKALRLAGLTSFHSEVKVFGDPSVISATGHISSKGSAEAEIGMEVRVGSEYCSSDKTFSCQLHYKTKDGQFEIAQVTKRGNKIDLPRPSSTSAPTSSHPPQVGHTLSSTSLADIEKLIRSHLMQMDEKSQRIVNFFNEMNGVLHNRLGKIETLLQAQREPLSSIDSNLQILENRIMSDIASEVGNVSQELSQVSGAVSHLAAGLANMQAQSNRLEIGLKNVSAVVGASLSSSSLQPLSDGELHQQWQAKLFGTMVEGFTLLSQLRTDLMKKLEAMENLHNQSLGELQQVSALETQGLKDFEDKVNNTLSHWLSHLKTAMMESLQAIENRVQISSDHQTQSFQNLQNDLLALAHSISQLESSLNQTSPRPASTQNSESLLWNLLLQHNNIIDQSANHQLNNLNNAVTHLIYQVQQIAQGLNSLGETVTLALTGVNKPALTLQDTKPDEPQVKVDISVSDLDITLKNLKFLLRR